MVIKTPASISFSNLLCGDIFRYNNHYFMRCESVADDYAEEGGYNSVCIENGELEYFKSTEMVEKISGTFVINS